ncbi:MAG: endonuclease domain-containing protein, partial [Beijerinckiaceae bacterium]
PGAQTRSDPPPQGEGWERPSSMQVRNARALRQRMTRYEVKLWLRLRELSVQGLRFRRQVPVNGFIADFACHASKLVVEVDGDQHGFDANRAADERRDAVLSGLGFLTMRFSNYEVWTNIEGVVEQIFSTGRERLP